MRRNRYRVSLQKFNQGIFDCALWIADRKSWFSIFIISVPIMPK